MKIKIYNLAKSIGKAGMMDIYMFILCILCGLSFWFNIYPHIPNWLSLMDGYFYGLIIKTYRLTLSLSSIDPKFPVSYPPYFFYLLGLIGRIFNINDLGVLQAFGFILAYSIFLMIYYILLRFLVSPLLAIWGVCLSLFVYIFSFGKEHILMKPHEIFSFTCLPILIVFLKLKTNAIKKFFFGALSGFFAGVYTPFVIIPLSTFLFLGIKKLFINKSLPNKIFDMYFWIGFLLLSSPYLFGIIKGCLLYKETPVVVFFTLDNYSLKYLTSGKESLTYWLGIFLSLLVFKTKGLKRRDEIELVAYAILFSVLFHLALIILFKYKIYTTMPFKYIFSIPFMTVLLTILALNVYKNDISGIIIGKKEKILKIMTIIICPIIFIVMFNCLKNNKIYKYSISLSVARNKNLSGLIEFFKKYFVKHSMGYPIYYIGEGEARFLDYYVMPLVNYLPFNESYTSRHMKLQLRANSLQQAINYSPLKFWWFLKKEKIKFIVLNKVTLYHSIAYSINKPPVMHIIKEIKLPHDYLIKLINKGLLNLVYSGKSFIVLEVNFKKEDLNFWPCIKTA